MLEKWTIVRSITASMDIERPSILGMDVVCLSEKPHGFILDENPILRTRILTNKKFPQDSH